MVKRQYYFFDVLTHNQDICSTGNSHFASFPGQRKKILILFDFFPSHLRSSLNFIFLKKSLNLKKSLQLVFRLWIFLKTKTKFAISNSFLYFKCDACFSFVKVIIATQNYYYDHNFRCFAMF